MRVIVYVPPGRGAQRTRRALERDVQAETDVTVIGTAHTAQDARLAIEAGLAEWVVGRSDHLLDLVKGAPDLLPWVRHVPPRPSRAAGAAILVPPLLVWGWIRRRPGWAIAATMIAGIAVAGVLLVPDGQRRPDALPAPSSSPTSQPGAPPATTSPAPSSPPPVSRAPSPTGAPGTAAGPSQPAEFTWAADSPRPAGPSASASRQPPRTSGPSTRPPDSPSARPTVSVSPPPAETPSTERRCILRLDLALVDVRLCLDRPIVEIRVLD
jgi:hypothetical protein